MVAEWGPSPVIPRPPEPEPYRDPDGPIHAVLAAANAVAPRCHLPDGVSLVHARYQYPACVPEAGSKRRVWRVDVTRSEQIDADVRRISALAGATSPADAVRRLIGMRTRSD